MATKTSKSWQQISQWMYQADNTQILQTKKESSRYYVPPNAM